MNTTQAARSTVRRHKLAALLAVAVFGAVLAGPATAGAATLQKGFWGPTTVNGVSQFPIYRDLGVTIYQMAVSWNSVAPTRPGDPRNPADPAYQWSPDVDYALQQAQLYNMRVMLMLVGSPSWANGGRASNFAPSRSSDFADFARAAARRYPTVRHWMVWGEPMRIPNFMPMVAQKKLGQALTTAQKRGPHRYAQLLDATYGALKAVNPRNLVIGGNSYTTGDIRPVRWIQNLKLPNGRPPRMDLYGHNPFSYRGPDLKKPQSDLELVDFSDLGRFTKKVDQYLGRPRHKRLRLFLSEFTVPTDAPDKEFNFFVTRALQAKWIRDGFKVAKSVNAYALGWIHLYDDPPAGGAPVVRGGLLTSDGTKKPGYFAFKRG
jgi:hypothetical protein